MSAVEFPSRRENPYRRPRGYADWSPHAKTKVLLEQVQKVFVTYEDHLPLTVRQVFYALVDTYGYEKTHHAYQRLCDHLVRARRAKLIPFNWLRDDGVVVMQERWFDGPGDFYDHIGRQAHDYRRDKQIGQPVYIELWTEAAGMMPQLAKVADKFSVPVYSCSGFASLPAIRHIVDRAYGRNVPTVILHVGDFDPSGEAVFEHIASDAAAFLEDDKILATQEILAERVALTAEQVETYGLPTSPAKGSHSDSAKWDGGTCQAESLPPDVLAGLVRAAIERHFDLDVVAGHVYDEDVERVQLLRALPSGGAS